MSVSDLKLQIFHSKGISNSGLHRGCNLASEFLHPSS